MRGQLEVAVDLHGDGGGKSVKVIVAGRRPAQKTLEGGELPVYAGGLKVASFLKIPLEFPEVRGCDLLGGEIVAVGIVKPGGESPKVPAVIFDGRRTPFRFL
jgi:hypothetical protein